MCVLRVSLGSPLFEDVGRQLPTNVVVRDRSADPGIGICDHAAASNRSCGYAGIEPQLDALVVRCGSSVAPGGDAESSARNIKAPCRKSTSRQHVVGGICVIAGQRVADPAMQIAVAQNSTESAAKYVSISDGVTPTPSGRRVPRSRHRSLPKGWSRRG